MIRTLAAIAICTTLMSCTSGRGALEEPLTLRAFSSMRPGEVILEWQGGPASDIRWQYRVSKGARDEDAWQDVPLKGSYSRTHRVTGLEAGWYDFEVRPRPAWNEEPSPPATAIGVALLGGPDGIVLAEGWTLPLERGGTFRISSTPYVFVVPAEGVFVGAFGEFETYHLVHQPTGAETAIDLRTGGNAEWWPEGGHPYRANPADSPAEREAYELLGQIRESIRYVPFAPHVSYAPGVEEGRAVAQWFAERGEGPWEYRLSRPGASPTAASSGWKSVPSRSLVLELSATPREGAPVRLLEMRPQAQAASSEPVVLRLQPPSRAADGLPRLSGEFSRNADFSHEGGRAYRLGRGYRLDIPPQMLIRAEQYGVLYELFASGRVPEPFGPSATASRILLLDERSGSYVLLDGHTYAVIERMARPHPEGSDSREMLDELVGSIRYSPWEFDAPLLAFSGGSVGEVILEWNLASLAPGEHWQYRYREVLYDESGQLKRGYWTRWADVPGGASAARHRVKGLSTGATHTFQVRPFTAGGPGVAHEAYGWAPPAGPGGHPLGRGLLESGRTFGVAGSSVVLDVPAGALVGLTVGPPQSDGDGNSAPLATIRDISSGSYLWISPRLGEQGRWIPPHAGPDAETLLDQIVGSLRDGP